MIVGFRGVHWMCWGFAPPLCGEQGINVYGDLASKLVAMEIEVVQWRGSVAGAGTSPTFIGEDELLVRIFEEQVLLLDHSDSEVRGEAIRCISVHLDLTKSTETRTLMKSILETQLWKEDDHFVVQKLIMVLASLALLPPPSTSSFADATSSVPNYLCTCGKRKRDAEGLCKSCMMNSVDMMQTTEGLVSSNTSPQKIEHGAFACIAQNGLDMHHSKNSRLVSGVDDAPRNVQVELVKSVASLLHTYLAKKDHMGSTLKTGVRMQILHSLLKLGETMEGVVTWVALGFVVRRYLSSSNPRIRALVLRLLVESIQKKTPFRKDIEALVSINGGVKEMESLSDAKRRRVGDLNASWPGEVSTFELASDLKSDRIEVNGEVVNGGTWPNNESPTTESEVLVSALFDYLKDPYPSVREAAARALIKLHAKGYPLTSESFKHATGLFQDRFEQVRIAAIQMVGIWMRTLSDVKSGTSSKQCNEAFLQVCTMVTDMNMKVREEVFRVLGEATWVGESVLLQALTKKVTGTMPKEKAIPASVSIATPDGDTDISKFEEGGNLLDASAAGAFVHGLEDEFLEVRCVAMEALAKLACKCEGMVPGAVNLLLDMLNDEVEVVRGQAMQALSQLAMAGHMSVQEGHLHMFLSVLEDTSADMRKRGRNLLTLSQFPVLGTFNSTIRALLTSLEHNPQDEEDIICTFSNLGQLHPMYTECIAHELLQEVQGFMRGEAGIDEPRCAALLSLFLGAGSSNPVFVSLIPAKLLSYATYLSHKLPTSLPVLKMCPLGLKTMQFVWSPKKNAIQSRSSRDTLATELTKDSHLRNGSCEGSVKDRDFNNLGHVSQSMSNGDKSASGCESFLAGMGGHLPFVSRAGKCNVSMSKDEKEVLDYVTHAVETANSVQSYLGKSGFQKALLVLSGCRKDIKMLQGRKQSYSAVVRFSALYVRCLMLIVQIRAHISGGKTHTNYPQTTTSVEKFCQLLELLVKHLLSCFSNLTNQQLVQLLELRSLVSVVVLATLPAGNNGDAVRKHLRQMRQTLIDSFLVYQKVTNESSHIDQSPFIDGSHSLEECLLFASPFLKLVQLELLGGKLEGLTQRRARELAISYWPKTCKLNGTMRETWAEVKALGFDFEHPLGFVPGLPLGIPLDIVVHNAPKSGGRFWVQYRVENLPPQYRHLDLMDATRCGRDDLRWQDSVVQVDYMPAVAGCAVKLCVVLESSLEEGVIRVGRGPKLPVIVLCVDIEAHVVVNKEKVTKVSQLRR